MKNICIGLIKGYQRTLSCLLPKQCRFYPSCSAYAIAAVEKNGALKGLWMALGRLLRCHPWYAGGWDPIK